jgi:hypothetical protein
MRPSPKLRPNGWDALVVLAVLALAAGIGLRTWTGGTADRLTAVISADGTVVERVDLSRLSGPEERMLTAGGYALRLSLSPEGAVMEEADCPTQDCVHTGRITRSGQSIVCLPARVIIRLEGTGTDGGPDVMIG